MFHDEIFGVKKGKERRISLFFLNSAASQKTRTAKYYKEQKTLQANPSSLSQSNGTTKL